MPPAPAGACFCSIENDFAMIAPRAAVATPHSDATRAARDILESGGNGFDAAVAAMLTLCVVQSHQVGLGGYGGNLVAYVAAENKVISIDFDSRAPYAFDPSLFTNPSDRDIGYKSISVPAVLAGLDLTLTTYGTRPWSAVTARAIEFAEHGFPTDEATARYLQSWTEKTDPESRKHLFPSSPDVPKQKDPWIQKDLANLLRRIAADGASAFYTGDVARQIISHIRSHGGILSERDFAEYRAQIVAPVCATYHDHQIYMPPPPGGGITTLQILKVLEHFDPRNLEPYSAEYFHLLAQAIHLCWADRTKLLGDPDVNEIPMADLLSNSNTRTKAQQISLLSPQGERQGEGRNARSPQTPPHDRMNHTANVTILDQFGNLVSITATQGMVFGSQVVIPGTGLIMNHGMSRFDYDNPSLPNAPQPGKRMHHNMAPTIVLAPAARGSAPQDSALSTQHSPKPRFACGLPGGTKIITVTAQLLINFIDYHTNPSDCILSPRIHTEPGEPLSVSSKVPDSVIAQLKSVGHTVIRGQTVGGDKREIAGNANALAIDPTTRVPSAASQASPDSAQVF